MMNGLEIGPFFVSFFTANSTFLLYNFHHIAFHLDYSSVSGFLRSLFSFRLLKTEKLLLISSLIAEVVLCFFFRPETFMLLLLIAIPALLYSIPLFGKGSRRKRLRELLFFKMPLLAFVWSFSTVIIPAVDSGIGFNSVYLWVQFISRFCFIFALCIPFDLRDVDFDREQQVKTIPVVFGDTITQWIGLSAVFLEVIIHHFAFNNQMISFNILTALDVSSFAAMLWVLFRERFHGKYFYKLLVDGTMILRFLLVMALTRL